MLTEKKLNLNGSETVHLTLERNKIFMPIFIYYMYISMECNYSTNVFTGSRASFKEMRLPKAFKVKFVYNCLVKLFNKNRVLRIFKSISLCCVMVVLCCVMSNTKKKEHGNEEMNEIGYIDKKK
jgi:hypothetical protein